MNRKEQFLKEMNEWKEFVYDNEDINQTKKDNCVCALEILEIVLTQRFDNTLKLYNNDVNKAWDSFSVKNILNQINLYVEEFYLADKDDIQEYKAIRKEMRNFVNMLWDFCKNELN
jgi:hypothetical protein